MSAADTALLFGYVLVAPFSVFVPGFLRMWRRREPELLATLLAGLAVASGGWLAKGRPLVAALHLLVLVGLTGSWLAGRRT